MKVRELRDFLRSRSVTGMSNLRKGELLKKYNAIKALETKSNYEKNFQETVKCYECLRHQRCQRQQDDQLQLASIKRDLVCLYCEHVSFAVDGNDTYCIKCGTLQESQVE